MLQTTNRSPRTVETYLRGVYGLERFLRERGMPTVVDAIAREHVEAYFADLLDRGYKATSAKAWYDGRAPSALPPARTRSSSPAGDGARRTRPYSRRAGTSPSRSSRCGSRPRLGRG
jgi:hypothetical protein